MYTKSIKNVKDNQEYLGYIITDNNVITKKVTNAQFINCVMECGSNIEFIDCTFTECMYLDFNNAYLTDVYHNKLCEGDIFGYKKVLSDKNLFNTNPRLIVKLLIPKEAKRSHTFSNKCRAEYAKVIEIYNIDGTISKKRTGYSSFDPLFKYNRGRIVKPKEKYEDGIVECASGIHFFRTFKEAILYNI